MKKDFGKYIIGVGLILVGLVLLGNLFNWWNFSIFFNGWWTLFIIIPALLSFASGFRFYKVFLLALGVLLLLSAQNVINWGDIWKFILPAAIIVWGLSIIFNKKAPYEMREKIANYNGDTVSYDAVFSGSKPVLDSNFKSGSFSAIFGGMELDLTRIEITQDLFIKATAVFGGIEIRVPQNVKIVTSETNIFGGTSVNARTLAPSENTPTIYLTSEAIFGGVEVK